MSDISSLIEVFRMEEIKPETRARIIIKLGSAINDSYASNISEGIVYELVQILDPQNEILQSEHYKQFVK